MLKNIKILKILNKKDQQKIQAGTSINPLESCVAQAAVAGAAAVLNNHSDPNSFEAHITYMIEYNAVFNLCEDKYSN